MKDSPFAFRRHHRLLTPADFQPLFDQPEFRVGGSTFLLLVRHNDLPQPRLGMVVGKRRVKRAVHRNLIRRVARESFRLRQAELAGLDILVLVKATPAQFDSQALRAELERLWDKLLAKRGQA